MSYTILTIPFDLKEKSEGDFLKKGFEIDDIIPDFFTVKEYGNTFLHYASFEPELIKKVAINLFVELNFPNSNLSKEFNDSVFNKSSFFDTKHLKLADAYINQADIVTLNENIVKQKNSTNNSNTIPYHAIYPRFIYKKEIESSEDTFTASFEIDKIKIYINRSNLTKKSICYGFIQIVLKWDFPNAQIMINNLDPISELFRYYGSDNKNKFELCWNNNLIKTEIEKIEERNRSGKVPKDIIEINNQKIDEYNKLLIVSPSQKIDIKMLVDKLLEQLNPSVNISKIFNFEEKIKPYILHLSNFQAANESKIFNVENKDVIRSVYRMIRIPGAENIEINELSNLNFVSPDLYSQQFILNEGAMVIEGIPISSDLLNKYYPSFLLALNQKYLFHYIQQKINELRWDEGSNKYNPLDLKELQETMIYAEFSQIFTSISNYNEIDLFFKKLRDQFKIKELKEEFLDSINGISKITQIEEKEKDEKIKEIDIKKNDKNNKRLNNILLILTIAQVWTGINQTLNFENKWKWYLNLTMFVIFATIIWNLIDIKKLIKKYVKKNI